MRYQDLEQLNDLDERDVKEIEIQEDLKQLLFTPNLYKVAYGGRGAAKSVSFARAQLIMMVSQYEKFLCTRQFQASIRDSVYSSLKAESYQMGMNYMLDFVEHCIRCPSTGSEAIFKGLHHNAEEIRSTYGVTKCWVEEANTVTQESWTFLLPTIRTQVEDRLPEIWISFNTGEEEDYTYRYWVLDPPPGTMILPINYDNNPWFPINLEHQRAHMERMDPELYQNVWLGKPLKLSKAAILADKIELDVFEPEFRQRRYYGADWGYSKDPTVLIECFIREEGTYQDLYVNNEAYGIGIELDKTPNNPGLEELFDTIPQCRGRMIEADGSLPAVISYMGQKGFLIRAAEKWRGSVEDGIVYLRSFRKIKVHAKRCPNSYRELRLYRWKTNAKTGEIYAKPEEGHDHVADSLRYALVEETMSRNTLLIWKKLAGY